jgi:outer membrane protein OmpU
MNKLTKVGCSALCSSLAAISAANAGDLTVTGGVDMTWMSLDNDTTGNPIGIGSNLTFKGSGELDNGWTFDLSIANANANAYSSSNVNLDMGMLGQLNIDQGDSGNGIAAIDDKMPTAWEEPWGAGLSTGVKTVVGAGSAMNIMYTTPKVLGITLTATKAFDMGTTDGADKTTGGVGTTASYDAAHDLTVNINPSFGTEVLSGLNIFAGGHEKKVNPRDANKLTGVYEGIAGITFDIGPLSFGAARSGHITGQEVTSTAVSHYTGAMYGVAFNINDDLSISYGFHNSRKAGFVNGSISQGSEENRRIEVESAQIAYTIGGASLRLAEVRGTNLHFSSTNDKDATVLSVGLAF